MNELKTTIVDRLLLLFAGLLAAFQIAVGIEGLSAFPTVAFSIAFGVILVSVLIIIILGIEILDSPMVVIISTLIPVNLAVGLIWQHFPSIVFFFLGFMLLGLFFIIITRIQSQNNKLSLALLIVVHGISGLIIFLLPIHLIVTQLATPNLIFVSLGGALMSAAGVLLALLKSGKPILSRTTIFRLFPWLLFAMTLVFVLGFVHG